MHLLDQFSAMDVEESKFTEYPEDAGGGVDRVEKLVLKKNVVGESKAFVLDEIPLLCLRNDLAQAIQAAGFKGLRFIPLVTYQNVKPR